MRSQWHITGKLIALAIAPRLPLRREVLVIISDLARRSGEEFGQPSVTTFPVIGLVGGVAEYRFAATRSADTGSAKDPGPKSREWTAALLIILVRRRARRRHNAAAGGSRRWRVYRHLSRLLRSGVRLDFSDGLFQTHLRSHDIRQVQRQVDTSHFRKEGGPRTIIQPSARIPCVPIERAYGLGHYRIIVSHCVDEC